MYNGSSNGVSRAAHHLACLMTATLLVACAADVDGPPPSHAEDTGHDAGAAADVPLPHDVAAPDGGPAARNGDAPGGDVLAADALVAAPDSAAGHTDAGDPCPGCDVLPPAPCEQAGSAVVAVADQPTGIFALGVRDDAALLAWVDGEAVHARLLDGAAVPVGETIVIQETGPPISDIEITPAPDGFAVFFSRGLLDDVASPDQVVLLQARVALDGTVSLPPSAVATGLQLARGSGWGDVGYRLWGLRDEEDPDTGGLSRQAAMARLSKAGEVEGLHYMLNAQKFTYMRLHHSGNQLNTPFVGPTEDKEVAYFLASIFLPGCGLPVLPVAALGPSASLAATGFISPQDALWAVRDEPAGAATGRLIFHDMSAVVTTERALPFPPSPLAELAANESNAQALLADVQGGSLVVCTADAAAREVGPSQTVEPLPAGATLLGLRALPYGGAWILAWIGGPSGEIRARRVCASP